MSLVSHWFWLASVPCCPQLHRHGNCATEWLINFDRSMMYQHDGLYFGVNFILLEIKCILLSINAENVIVELIDNRYILHMMQSMKWNNDLYLIECIRSLEHICCLTALNIYGIIQPRYYKIYLDKGIKNGCPCIVDIRGTQGCALVGDPARAVGECRDVAKAQP